MQRLVFIKLHRLIRNSGGVWQYRQITEYASPTWPVLYDCEDKRLALPLPQQSCPSCVFTCHSELNAVQTLEFPYNRWDIRHWSGDQQVLWAFSAPLALVRTSRCSIQHRNPSLGHFSLGSGQGPTVMLEGVRKQPCWQHWSHLQLLERCRGCDFYLPVLVMRPVLVHDWGVKSFASLNVFMNAVLLSSSY